MGKWSGRGIPPTRRKLHAWRQKQYLERQEDLAAQRAFDRELDESARRSGVNTMLVEN